MDMVATNPRLHSERGLLVASYVLAGVALLAILKLHLLPTLIAGLLVYELVDLVSPKLRGRIESHRARVLALAVVASGIVGALVLAGIGIASFVEHEIGRPGAGWEQSVMPIVEKARQQFPQAWVAWLPASIEELRTMASGAFREHARALGTVGVETARVLVHILIGLILGGVLALSQAGNGHRRGPLASVLVARCAALSDAFHDIVFAQVKISLLNTLLTGLFLLVALPAFGVHIPFAKTLVVLTFIAGLLPVVGNLISNAAITVAGLSLSPVVGLVALGYLIVIHKVEYFLNARIVGGQIRARAWELLIAMLVAEAAFGVAGVVAGPIFYAYMKRELKTAELV